MSLFLMSLLGGRGRGSKQIKPMSLYILFFFIDGFPEAMFGAVNTLFLLKKLFVKRHFFYLTNVKIGIFSNAESLAEIIVA